MLEAAFRGSQSCSCQWLDYPECVGDAGSGQEEGGEECRGVETFTPCHVPIARYLAVGKIQGLVGKSSRDAVSSAECQVRD